MQPLFVALLPDKGGENLVLFFIFNPLTLRALPLSHLR